MTDRLALKIENEVLRKRIQELEREKNKISAVDFDKFSKIKGNGHILTVNGKSSNIEGRIVCTGQYTVPANSIDFRKVLNLTDFFFPDNGKNLFSEAYGNSSTNISDRVQLFLNKHIDIVKNSDYFIAAVNKTKSEKRDLPNVNAIVLLWLLQHHHRDVEFMDPINFLKDPLLSTSTRPINITNMSVVVLWIKQNLRYDVKIDPNDDGIVTVRYQRGTGVPSSREVKTITEFLGNQKLRFHHVMLTPGKYDWDGKSYGVPRMCYKEFEKSIAHLVNQFTDFNQYLHLSEEKSIKQIYLVMDEFSGYSMFTIAALVGFGFDKITSVLCYFRGNYTSFKLEV